MSALGIAHAKTTRTRDSRVTGQARHTTSALFESIGERDGNEEEEEAED